MQSPPVFKAFFDKTRIDVTAEVLHQGYVSEWYGMIIVLVQEMRVLV